MTRSTTRFAVGRVNPDVQPGPEGCCCMSCGNDICPAVGSCARTTALVGAAHPLDTGLVRAQDTILLDGIQMV
jgi:hypothetical protein